jgi:hypothetical protein
MFGERRSRRASGSMRGANPQYMQRTLIADLRHNPYTGSLHYRKARIEDIAQLRCEHYGLCARKQLL